ncbi:MAG: DnaD domain protein [Lachnospiraceae bacterium]|nr:DnaD domain protein [Lachnospiraceae bacterium]
MSSFKLQQEGFTSTTSVPNCFIEKYMPKAAGEFVKIYIYLLKCLEENQSELSLSRIADSLEDSEKDIVRALRYWERKGLLKLVFEDKTLVSLQLISADEIRSGDGDAASSLEEPSASVQVQVQTRDSQTSDVPAEPKKKQYSPAEIEQFSGKEDVSQLIYIIQKYMGRALTGTDLNTVFFFYDTLGLPTEVIEYLFEYCVSNGHKSIRYIEKTAIGWAEQGITTLPAAKALNTIYSSNCYPVLKAFGLTGRQPSKSESDYVAKWSLSYGYSLEIILEACNRTMKAIHQPSFEYTDTILNRWKASNVVTMDDIRALDAKREDSIARAEKIAGKKKGAGTESNKAASGRSSSNKFNTFDQRTYDYSTLEEKLFNT